MLEGIIASLQFNQDDIVTFIMCMIDALCDLQLVNFDVAPSPDIRTRSFRKLITQDCGLCSFMQQRLCAVTGKEKER